MPTVNLGQISAIHISTTAPSNTKMMWYDDNTGQKILKYYDVGTSTWKSFDGVGVYVPITGGTMTGLLTLSADPTAALHAATKQYVDSQVTAAAGTLSGILSGGNTTGGTSIVMTSGDTLNFSRGFGGGLDSASTTVARTWTLPDADGTLLLGTGTTNKVARWNSGALADGVLQDNGTTAGIGGLVSTRALNIATTLASGLYVAVANTTAGTAITGISNGVNSTGNNVGGYFEGNDSVATNIGIHVKGDSNSNLGAKSYGILAESVGSDTINVGVHGTFGSIGNQSIGIFGGNAIATFSGTGTISGLYGGLDENGVYDIDVDQLSIYAAVVGHYKGTQLVGSTKYAGYFKNEVTNAGQSNIGGYFEATGGGGNYAIVTGGGNVGINVAAPTKIFEASSGNGKVRIDTTAVVTPYNFDIELNNTSAVFKTDLARNIRYSINGTIVGSYLATGGLAVGVHSTVDSQLHVKYSGALADMDGGIRGTMSNNTPYVYATLTYSSSLILENEDITTSNTSAVVYRTKDTGGTLRDGAYIGARYHTRGGTTVTSDLVFGVSNAGTMLEAMRIHSSGNVVIGGEADESKMFVFLDSNTSNGILVKQDNEGTSARADVIVSAKDTLTNYTAFGISATGDGATGSGSWAGLAKYWNKTGHLATDVNFGHINIYARSTTGTPLYDIRMFTGGQDYDENKLRMTVKSDGKFGFNLAKAGYTGSAVDTPLSEFHVGTGALFEATGANDNFIVKSHSSVANQGGLVVTSSSSFVSGTGNHTGWKFVGEKNDSATTYTDDSLTIGLVDASASSTFVNTHIYLKNGKTSIGSNVVDETLTVHGVTSLAYQSASPSLSSGFGKVYAKSDNNLYYMDALGIEIQLNVTPMSGSGTDTQVAYFTGGSTLASNSNFTFDYGTNTLTVGNLVVNGTTTTVNSTVVTIADPIFTLGGTAAPTSDDNKDRGIEFRWHNGSVAKAGFFGYDDSTGRFTFIPDGTNTSEVYSGTKGDIDVATVYSTGLSMSTGAGSTLFMSSDAGGVATWSSINSLVADSAPNGGSDYVMTWDASAGVHKKVLISAISSGAPHNLLDGLTHPDTQSATVQRGDLIIGSGATAKWDRLAKGTATQYLKSNGTDLLWATIGIGDITGGISGTGTANQVTYWSGAQSLSSTSAWLWDGSNMGIHTATATNITVDMLQLGSSQYTTLRVSQSGTGTQERKAIEGVVTSAQAFDNVALSGVASGSTTINYGIKAIANTNTTGSNVGGYFEAANAGTGAHYAIQIVDGNQAVGKFLRSIDSSGHGKWATIDITDITNSINGTGLANRVAYWSDTDTLTYGIIRENGTSIGIGSNPLATSTLYMVSSVGTGLAILNTYSSTSFAYGAKIDAIGLSYYNIGLRVNSSNGSISNTGIQAITSGTAGTSIALEAIATSGSTGTNYAGIFTATNGGAGAHYALKIQDGLEASGKFLKSVTASGEAQWQSIVSSDITDLTFESGTGTILKNSPRAFLALTDAATITWDYSQGYNAQVTLGGNRTLAEPTNTRDGDYGYLEITQDATGSRTLILPASFKVVGGSGGAIQLSTTPGAVDSISWVKRGAEFHVTYGLNFT